MTLTWKTWVRLKTLTCPTQNGKPTYATWQAYASVYLQSFAQHTTHVYINCHLHSTVCNILRLCISLFYILANF